MTRFVIDASVVLTWCFPDENSALAHRIADIFKQGGTAIAPAFWPHEVLNGLQAGAKRKRISQALVRTFLDDLANLPVSLEQVSAKLVFERIERLSRRHGLTTYDAAYLDLALEHELPVATLDEQLARSCKKAKGRLIQL